MNHNGLQIISLNWPTNNNTLLFTSFCFWLENSSCCIYYNKQIKSAFYYSSYIISLFLLFWWKNLTISKEFNDLAVLPPNIQIRERAFFVFASTRKSWNDAPLVSQVMWTFGYCCRICGKIWESIIKHPENVELCCHNRSLALNCSQFYLKNKILW